MPKPTGKQFQQEAEDGPYCNNCSDDFEEVMEWNSRDRQDVRPENRVPCVGCGAI